MSKHIETGEFQALTEQESLHVDGGAELGIATTWIALGRDITIRAIQAVQGFFGAGSELGRGMGSIANFLSGLFNDIIGSLGQRGL